MKINGTDTNLIRFHHDGMIFSFQYMRPGIDAYRDFAERIEESVISFSDLSEVDEMIMMLERFKNECASNMKKARPYRY